MLPERKLINGKPLWEIKMEMRALRQRFNLTDGQCNELLIAMQDLALDKNCSEKYRIGAVRAILGMMRIDQISAIELLRMTGKQSDGVPEDELDDVIEGELAILAIGPQAPSAGPDQGPGAAGGSAADADDPDEPPAGLS